MKEPESKQTSHQFTQDELKEAFAYAHNTAISEYLDRCKQVKASETTSYDVDPDNKEFAKNIAKVCLIANNKESLATGKDDTLESLANNVPCELMPKVIASINGDTITEKNIKDALNALANAGFNINKPIEDMQGKIDKLAEEQERKLKQKS